MRDYKLKQFCSNCNKELSWNMKSDFDLSEEDIDRFTNELADRHKFEEHTHCSACGIKVNPKDTEIQIVGRQDPSEEETKKGVAFTMLFGYFCKKCNELIEKSKDVAS